MKDDDKVKKLSIAPVENQCNEKDYYSSTVVGSDGLVKIKFHPNRTCNKILKDSKTRLYKLFRADKDANACRMQYFDLNCNLKPQIWTEGRRILTSDLPNSVVDLVENAKVFWDFENNQALKKATTEDMKLQSFFNPEITKESISKKFEKIEEVGFWVRLGALISAPFLGINLALIAMNLSMIIKVFHIMVLFNTKLGSYINYFLVATTDVIKGAKGKDDKESPKFIPRYENIRLIDDAELNSYTTYEHTVDLCILLFFWVLRFIRHLLRNHAFAHWEELHGEDIYRTEIKPVEDPKVLVIAKKDTEKAGLLNQKVAQEEKDAQKFKLNCWHKTLIKLYSLTYILEFILFCRLMSDIILHAMFNTTAVSFAKNEITFKFLFNLVASAVALMVFVFELLRFIRINQKFMGGVLNNKYKQLQIKKFEKLKKLKQQNDKKQHDQITLELNGNQIGQLTTAQINVLSKNACDLDQEELDMIDGMSWGSDEENALEDDNDKVLGMCDDNGCDKSSESEEEDGVVLTDPLQIQKAKEAKKNKETVEETTDQDESSFDETTMNNDGQAKKLEEVKVGVNEEYSRYNWRKFQEWESAKLLQDNFKCLPVPIKPNLPASSKKNSGYVFKYISEHLNALPGQFLPYLNLYIACRLVIFYIAIIFLQNLSVIQIAPVLAVEIFVTIAILQGNFIYECFEAWGFFRFMCQQITISLILFLGIVGTDPMHTKSYGNTPQDKGKLLDTSSLIDDENIMEKIAVAGVVMTILIEIIEIFRKWYEDLRDAWIKGGHEGRHGLMRIFGSNEGSTVFLENLLM